MQPSLKELEAWYHQHQDQIIDRFFSFLKIPSISTDPAYAADIRKAAQFVSHELKQIGFKADLWESKGYPIVFASSPHRPSRPTVLIYHHYDVQPVDPLEKWISPPFEPQIREKLIYARGASDNKGQCFATLTALRALFELCKTVDLNIKLFIEGEEESGSESAFHLLKEKKEALKADYLLIADMGLPAPNTPAITLGLRGISTLEIKCTNSKIDLHSGIHGGIALNPNRALVQLLAKLWDNSGKIAIPHFYDDVVTPSSEELAELFQTIDRPYLEKQFGLKAFQGEGGYSLWESNTLRPTVEINGISGGYTGAGFKTVIPSQAIAKISCRTVPNQDPLKVARSIAQFLTEEAPPGIILTPTYGHQGKPIRVSPKTKLAGVCADVYTEVFGTPCKKILCGASVPIVTDLAATTKAEVAMIGVALDSDDIHAPNEHFGLAQLQKGVLTMGRILGRLAEC